MRRSARRSWRRAGIVALCASLIACRTDDRPAPTSGTSAATGTAPSASASSDGPSSAVPPRMGPPASGSADGLPRPFPPFEGPPAQLLSPVLLDVATGSWVGGMAVDVRPLVRDLVAGDPVGIALRVRVPGAPAFPSEWALLKELVFVVHAPDGVTHHLEADGLTSGDVMWMLDLDAEGVSNGTIRRAWKSPVPGLFSAPGTYRLEASVEVERNRGDGRRLQSGTLTFEVRAPSPDRLALASIDRLAAGQVRRTARLASAPDTPARVLQHVSGELSVRHSLPEPSQGWSHDVVEVWLDRRGAVTHVDAYRAFGCVAAGTSVATPTGPVPIEALSIGDEVLAFDVVHHRRAVARVEQMLVHHQRPVLGFGALTVTAEHPVWADGQWRSAGDLRGAPLFLGVDLVPQRRAPVVLAETASVYDLAVTEPHTFFAGGVLVHNKSRWNPPPSLDPWGPAFYRFSAGKPD